MNQDPDSPDYCDHNLGDERETPEEKEISRLQTELTHRRTESLRLASANDALEKERDGLREEKETSQVYIETYVMAVREIGAALGIPPGSLPMQMPRFIGDAVVALQAQLSTAKAAEARLRACLEWHHKHAAEYCPVRFVQGKEEGVESVDPITTDLGEAYVESERYELDRAALATAPPTAALPDGERSITLPEFLSLVKERPTETKLSSGVRDVLIAAIEGFLGGPCWPPGEYPYKQPLTLHTHVNSGIAGNDSCKACGLDLRDPIHIRAAIAGATK